MASPWSLIFTGLRRARSPLNVGGQEGPESCGGFGQLSCRIRLAVRGGGIVQFAFGIMRLDSIEGLGCVDIRGTNGEKLSSSICIGEVSFGKDFSTMSLREGWSEARNIAVIFINWLERLGECFS